MTSAELSMPAAIAIDRLSQSFAGKTVLDSISLNIPKGTILALLGPSGCGKSTLLKLLAGLLQPDAGTIHFGDRQVASSQQSLPPEQRNLGMVFQDYALWPHMSVAQNVGFPLLMRNVPRDVCQQRVELTLGRVGLAGFANRKPADLSGGQQQRVALARAIIAEPHILLFDEPLSNLDWDLRESLCQEMASLLRHLGTTAVYVTHDRSEANMLAHRVVHMSQGHITDVTTL